VPVTTAADVVAAVAEMPAEDLPAILAAVAARLATTRRAAAPAPAALAREADVWIDAAAAASIAGVSKKVVYDWAARSGSRWASRPSRRCLRVNERAFRAWLTENC
jgi:hypothetical protein